MEQHNHIPSLISWLADKWQLVIFVISALTGLFWWWLRSVFSTKEHMTLLKNDMLHELKMHEQREDAALKNDRDENRAEHKELRSDLRAIKDYLIGKYKE